MVARPVPGPSPAALPLPDNPWPGLFHHGPTPAGAAVGDGSLPGAAHGTLPRPLLLPVALTGLHLCCPGLPCLQPPTTGPSPFCEYHIQSDQADPLHLPCLGFSLLVATPGTPKVLQDRGIKKKITIWVTFVVTNLSLSPQTRDAFQAFLT